MTPCSHIQCNYDPDRPICQACKALQKIWNEKYERREDNRREYERLKKDSDYKHVRYDEKLGGVSAEHIGHIVHHNKNEERFFHELTKNGKGFTSTQLERCCQSNIYRMGHKAILRNEKIYTPDGKQLPALDLNIDGKIMDIASITTAEKYGGIILSKNRQLGNVKLKTGLASDSLCLYFHKPDSFSESQLLNDIEWYRKRVVEVGSHQRIKHIYVVVNKSNELKVYDI